MRSGLTALALAAAAVVASGCDSKPLAVVRTDNPAITVDFLFEQDGCRVYRFVDAARNQYFATCGSRARVSWQELHSGGKTTYTIPRSVETVVRAND